MAGREEKLLDRDFVAHLIFLLQKKTTFVQKIRVAKSDLNSTEQYFATKN